MFIDQGLDLLTRFMRDTASMTVIDGRVMEIREVLDGRVDGSRWYGSEGASGLLKADVTVITDLYDDEASPVTIPTELLEEIILDWRVAQGECQSRYPVLSSSSNPLENALSLLVTDGVQETVTWRRVKSLFPSDWDRDRVLGLIVEVFERDGYFVAGMTFEGYTHAGVKVIHVLDDQLRIIAAYPRLNPAVRSDAVGGEATRFFPIDRSLPPLHVGKRIFPVVFEEVADEGLLHVLHSDSGLFRGGGLARFDDVLAGRVERVEVSGLRTRLVIGREVTTVTDLYADPEHGVGFVPLVIGTGELRANVVAWLRIEDDFFGL